MRYSQVLAVALALGSTALTHTVEAQAQSARAVRASVESSMVLTGHVDIGTEGNVEGFHLDKREQVPANLVAFVEAQVKDWRFERVLVDGKAVPARTPVTLRLVAKPDDKGGSIVRLAAASFEQYRDEATDSVTRLTQKAPVYPRSVFDMGGQGEVVLLLKVGADGRVVDVFAEQVNLGVYGTEPQMRRMRDELARASIAAARDWTYRTPTTGEARNASSWDIRVPVSYAISYPNGKEKGGYGRWESYIPGPRGRAPWRTGGVAADASADLLPSGGVFMADVSSGPRLLTPLGG